MVHFRFVNAFSFYKPSAVSYLPQSCHCDIILETNFLFLLHFYFSTVKLTKLNALISLVSVRPLLKGNAMLQRERLEGEDLLDV